MIAVRKSEERGPTNIGWLDSRHTFSFGEYYDPRFMGFRALRVINEDRVAPGTGFPTHGHRDMEILSYVIEGALEHKDSLGTGSIIRPGDVQRMSAGKGVFHSEYNPSQDKPVHFLQIWIEPEAKSLAPSYEQRSFDQGERMGRLKLVASRDARHGSLRIHQNASIYASILNAGASVAFEPDEGRHVWVQVARGLVEVNGASLAAGDGASLSGEAKLSIRAAEDAEFLLFDLA